MRVCDRCQTAQVAGDPLGALLQGRSLWPPLPRPEPAWQAQLPACRYSSRRCPAGCAPSLHLPTKPSDAPRLTSSPSVHDLEHDLEHGFLPHTQPAHQNTPPAHIPLARPQRAWHAHTVVRRTRSILLVPVVRQDDSGHLLKVAPPRSHRLDSKLSPATRDQPQPPCPHRHSSTLRGEPADEAFPGCFSIPPAMGWPGCPSVGPSS